MCRGRIQWGGGSSYLIPPLKVLVSGLRLHTFTSARHWFPDKGPAGLPDKRGVGEGGVDLQLCRGRIQEGPEAPRT